jgi:hypothetical protein
MVPLLAPHCDVALGKTEMSEASFAQPVDRLQRLQRLQQMTGFVWCDGSWCRVWPTSTWRVSAS